MILFSPKKPYMLKIISAIANLFPPHIKKVFYRLGPFSRIIRNLLNKIAPTGLHVVEVATGGNKGMQMKLDLQTEKDYWLGTYEIDLQEGAKELVQKDWVVYDVGANIGFFTLLFSKLVGDKGKVFSFEPLPSNLERLNENISLNALELDVKVFPLAVVDESKNVTFLISKSRAMGKVVGSTGRENGHLYVEKMEVTGISLDDFIFKQNNPPPQVIKMDIEGGEVLAICGMTKLLETIKPLLFLELHGENAAREVWKTLEALGYHFHELKFGFPLIHSLDRLDWKSYLVAIP